VRRHLAQWCDGGESAIFTLLVIRNRRSMPRARRFDLDASSLRRSWGLIPTSVGAPRLRRPQLADVIVVTAVSHVNLA